MNEEKLREFLRKGAPLVPQASPFEYQAIVRRIQREEEEPKIKPWQIWSIAFASLTLVAIYAGFAWQSDLEIEEELFRDLTNAEWVRTNESESYKDWLQLLEYSDEKGDEI